MQKYSQICNDKVFWSFTRFSLDKSQHYVLSWAYGYMPNNYVSLQNNTEQITDSFKIKYFNWYIWNKMLTSLKIFQSWDHNLSTINTFILISHWKIWAEEWILMIHLRFAKQISISISAADFHFNFLLVSLDKKMVLGAFGNDSFSKWNPKCSLTLSRQIKLKHMVFP